MNATYIKPIFVLFLLLGGYFFNTEFENHTHISKDLQTYSHPQEDSLRCTKCVGLHYSRALAIKAPKTKGLDKKRGSGFEGYCNAYHCYQGKCMQCRGYGDCIRCYGKGIIKKNKEDCPACENGKCNVCLGTALCAVCKGDGMKVCRQCNGLGKYIPKEPIKTDSTDEDDPLFKKKKKEDE